VNPFAKPILCPICGGLAHAFFVRAAGSAGCLFVQCAACLPPEAEVAPIASSARGGDGATAGHPFPHHVRDAFFRGQVYGHVLAFLRAANELVEQLLVTEASIGWYEEVLRKARDLRYMLAWTPVGVQAELGILPKPEGGAE
jgi:hypothetical protein